MRRQRRKTMTWLRTRQIQRVGRKRRKDGITESITVGTPMMKDETGRGGNISIVESLLQSHRPLNCNLQKQREGEMMYCHARKVWAAVTKGGEMFWGP
jgi:hypothetical protein